jgi:anthranilate phosphoribosyltransferase
MIDALTERARLGELIPADLLVALDALTRENLDPQSKADFLIALARRGETPAEIATLAASLRDRAVPVPVDPTTRNAGLLDVCGTGGDRQHTFNISTTVALLVASAGVAVAKHGNRAITSRSGSADVLEALGIPVELTPDQAAAALRDQHFAFLFAPRYHPAFRHIAPARKICAERGQRTVFNILGPLLNPARPDCQLMGVPHPDLCEPIAQVLQQLGLRRAMVVCGHTSSGYLDELSSVGDTTIAEFHHERGFSVSTLSLDGFPIQSSSMDDLAGGDRDENAAILRRILSGEERGPKRDAVLLNAGAALFIAGRTRSILEGWELAEQLIESGQAHAYLTSLTANSPLK